MITVNILLCDTFPGRLPDFIPNYESLFMDLFVAIGEEVNYRIFQTWQGELPSDIHTDELYYFIKGGLFGEKRHDSASELCPAGVYVIVEPFAERIGIV